MSWPISRSISGPCRERPITRQRKSRCWVVPSISAVIVVETTTGEHFPKRCPHWHSVRMCARCRQKAGRGDPPRWPTDIEAGFGDHQRGDQRRVVVGHNRAIHATVERQKYPDQETRRQTGWPFHRCRHAEKWWLPG